MSPASTPRKIGGQGPRLSTAFKRELVFTLMMVSMMAFFMSLVNVSIGMGRIPMALADIAAFLRALAIAWPVAFVLEMTVVSRLARWIVGLRMNDVKDLRILNRGTSFCIVTMMSAIMTIFGLLMFSNVPLGTDSVLVFAVAWPRNFMIALFFQWYVAAPVVGRSFSWVMSSAGHH